MQGLDTGVHLGRWVELMMFMLTTMSEVTLMLSMLDVADSMAYRKCLGFPDASPEAHPLLGVEVLIMREIEVLCTQQ